jgi:hypothetical protein
MGLVHTGEAPGLWRVAGPQVVVAAHHQDLQPAPPLAPGAHRVKHRRREPGAGVGEVAEHEEPPRPAANKRRVEPRQVARRASLGDRDRRRPKARRLADVRVRDQQRRAARPEQGALGHEQNRLAGQGDVLIAHISLSTEARSPRRL